MSCTDAVVQRTYVIDVDPAATGFTGDTALASLGRKGVITNVKARLDNTNNGVEALALYIVDNDDLADAPDDLDVIFKEEFIGLEASATEASYDRDIEKYYSVSNSGDVKLGLNILDIGTSGNPIRVYVTVTARLCS